ncbi:AAA family ATPase [uncultured Brachyspira sp.]|uniref:AAA family ATPase n=6 Tax=uncultured Brachyspira sp. TaxID=221953 RepID=UPI0025D64CF4|nr:AAA family ATPase [uncultured Brachyspira sp.]
MLEETKYPILYVKNFAKIKEAEIELAPFTLFVGDNNSGKSYLASLVWYIQNIDLLYKFYKDKDYPKVESLDNLSNKVINENISNLKIDNNIINDIIKTINNVLENNKEIILNDIFNSKNIKIDKIYILEYKMNYGINIDFFIDKKTDYNDNNREVKYYLDITFTINNCKYKKEKYKKIEINNKNDLSLFLLKKLYFLIFNSKHQLFLPVSRTGFLLLKDLIIQKSISTLWYNPYDLSRKIDLTLPIKNFFEQLSIILKKNDSFSFGIQIKENIKYENIISLIEKNILEGEICIENTLSILPMNAFPLSQYNTLDTIREIFYKTNNSDNNFSMHVSSAVVTEVTPIALFLKYGIDYNNIIMEEPEISLHPELQQQLTRVFIKLVNINTHVLITTHSDTIIQHINNMIKLNSNNEERKKYLMHKYGYDDDDLISEDKVRMYQFDINKEDGFTKVTKLESSEYGFEVPTFNKVLKKISDEIYDFQEEL